MLEEVKSIQEIIGSGLAYRGLNVETIWNQRLETVTACRVYAKIVKYLHLETLTLSDQRTETLIVCRIYAYKRSNYFTIYAWKR